MRMATRTKAMDRHRRRDGCSGDRGLGCRGAGGADAAARRRSRTSRCISWAEGRPMPPATATTSERAGGRACARADAVWHGSGRRDLVHRYARSADGTYCYQVAGPLRAAVIRSAQASGASSTRRAPHRDDCRTDGDLSSGGDRAHPLRARLDAGGSGVSTTPSHPSARRRDHDASATGRTRSTERSAYTIHAARVTDAAGNVGTTTRRHGRQPRRRAVHGLRARTVAGGPRSIWIRRQRRDLSRHASSTGVRTVRTDRSMRSRSTRYPSIRCPAPTRTRCRRSTRSATARRDAADGRRDARERLGAAERHGRVADQHDAAHHLAAADHIRRYGLAGLSRQCARRPRSMPAPGASTTSAFRARGCTHTSSARRTARRLGRRVGSGLGRLRHPAACALGAERRLRIPTVRCRSRGCPATDPSPGSGLSGYVVRRGGQTSPPDTRLQAQPSVPSRRRNRVRRHGDRQRHDLRLLRVRDRRRRQRHAPDHQRPRARLGPTRPRHRLHAARWARPTST